MDESEKARFLELNEDEAEHRSDVAEDIAGTLELANNAAALALNGLMMAEDVPRLNEPKGIASLLLAKAAQNVRFACTGLTLGYYSGSSGALRSAYEALIYAALFSTSPEEIPIWIRIEFSETPEPDRADQKRRAKRALLDQEKSRHVIKEALIQFVEDGNRRIHSTVKGLADEFGIDIDYLLPDDLEESFLQLGEDFDMAVSLSAFASKHDARPAQNGGSGGSAEQEIINVDLVGRYDAEMLEDIATFALYLGHRLLDWTADTFTINDRDFTRGYRDWHKELENSA